MRELGKLVIVVAFAFAGPLRAADYYFDPAGDDTNSGTDANQSFKTLKRAAELALAPGDQLLFKGGATFTGNLILPKGASGTKEQKITITSFGEGRAIIQPDLGDGIFVENAEGIKISNLEVLGKVCPTARARDADCHRSVGTAIHILNSLVDNAKLKDIEVSDVEVHGFAAALDWPGADQSSGPDGMGIFVKSTVGTAGFENMLIQNAKSYDNFRAGIVVDSNYPNRGNINVQIINSESYGNMGMPKLTHHTGSGIILAGADNSLIQGCFAHDNGTLNDSGGGPVGIWSYNVNNVLIRGNKSMRNWTRGSSDGGGFDFDGGVTNSVMEYNYSEGNAGPGYLYAQYPGAPFFTGNTIRHNTSVNDARNNYSGSAVIWGNVLNSDFVDNLFVSSMNNVGYSAPVFASMDWVGIGVKVQRNIFIVHSNTLNFDYWLDDWTPPNLGSDLLFDGNSYLNCEHGFKARYRTKDVEKIFTALDDWHDYHIQLSQFEPSGVSPQDPNEKQKYCLGYKAGPHPDPDEANDDSLRRSHRPYREGESRRFFSGF